MLSPVTSRAMARSFASPRRALAALVLGAMVASPLVLVSPAAATTTGPSEVVVDLTFPTGPGVRYSDDYTSPRGGGTRMHCATDILGAKHAGVYAAVGGTISFIPMSRPSYGYMISVRGDDGRSYSYIHLNDDTPGTNDDAAGPEHAYAPGLARGSRVERGQLIGWLGDSGNAKGTDHLHFEIHDPAVENPPCETGGINRINPFLSLQAAEARGDYGGMVRTPVRQARGIERACPAGRVPERTFADVSGTHRPGVDCVAWWGITVGKSDGIFGPAQTVTRAQLATFVARLAATAGAPLSPAGADHFDDDAGSVHSDSIDRVATAGIMSGTERTFAPDASVTRGQMATVVARTYRHVTGSELASGGDAFADDDGGVHELAIDRLASAALAVGTVDGRFHPATPVSREQMATFLARLLDLLVEDGQATPPA